QLHDRHAEHAEGEWLRGGHRCLVALDLVAAGVAAGVVYVGPRAAVIGARREAWRHLGGGESDPARGSDHLQDRRVAGVAQAAADRQRPRPAADSISEGDVLVKQEPELNDSGHENQQQRQDDRELDHRLPVLPAAALPSPLPGTRRGSPLSNQRLPTRAPQPSPDPRPTLPPSVIHTLFPCADLSCYSRIDPW